MCPEGASRETPVDHLQNAVKDLNRYPLKRFANDQRSVYSLILMRRFPVLGATLGLSEVSCMPRHGRQDSKYVEAIGLASAVLSASVGSHLSADAISAVSVFEASAENPHIFPSGFL